MSLDRLASYLSGRGPAWYAATAPDPPPAPGEMREAGPRTRRDVLQRLVADLAALGEQAGTGQPPGARPPVLGDHAFADQLLVLGHELASAPRPVDAEVDRLVAAARTRL